MELIKKLGKRLSKNGNSYQYWSLFSCIHCGKEVEKRSCNGKRAKSCGCIPHNYKHGEGHGTRLFTIWTSMKNRCLNNNCRRYIDWGGRGIKVCPEWTDKKSGFINFKNWALSNGYTDNLEINRINNNGNYEPSNCNFITSQENSQNRRSTKLCNKQVKKIRDLYKTGQYTTRELAKLFHLKSKSTIVFIINNKTRGNIRRCVRLMI